MSLSIHSLGSGSKGNAFIVQNPFGTLLIDAGFSRKELLRRLELAAIDPHKIDAMLLTHEHEDHSRGCRVFADHFNLPVFATLGTVNHLADKNLPNRENITLISTGSKFELAGFSVLPFPVQHDASDPCGFVISWNGKKIGMATDIGAVNNLVRTRLSDCDILLLESNYDLDMLHHSHRPLHLKRRIIGRNGHLGNDKALEELQHLLTARTRFLMLVHLSNECNDYELLRSATAERLQQLNRSDIVFEPARQDGISGGFKI